MAKVSIYQPKSILIPESSSVQRNYPRYLDVPTEHRGKLDVKTVFFDVFFDESSQCLMGLGPKLFNLKQDLFPMSICVQGRSLRYDLQFIKDLIFFKTDKIPLGTTSQLEATFHFKPFSQKITIRRSSRRHCVDRRLTLTTLQKDNPIPWISDWITWYYESYGVDRLILYDNNSATRDDVLEFLEKVESDIEIIFVDWRFVHGFHPYKYCQRGSLNHCRIRFGVNNGYCLNFDVDEYLMCRQKNLVKFLDQKLQYPRPTSVGVAQIEIIDMPPDTDESPIRCWHFKYRKNTPDGKKAANPQRNSGKTKYIYRFNDVGYNSVHTTDSEKNGEFCRKRYSLTTMISYSLKRVIWEITKKMLRHKYRKPRIDMTYVDTADAHYFHFYGLHTGWSRHGGLPKRSVAFDPNKHIAEPRIKKIESTVRDFHL